MPLLRVLTVNIHKGFGFLNRRYTLAHLRDAVRSTAADVVFLQEVMGAHATHAKRVADWKATPHYEYLADTLWSAFAYGRNAVHPSGDHHGNAVLSKYPILRHENRDVSIAGRDHEKRGLLHCVLDVPGARGAVHAVCVHLGLGEAQRRQQLELMCDLVSIDVPPAAPLVVAGDFNDWRMRAHRILSRCAGLIDVHRHAHGRSARTFPARWPLLSLDRIYVRNVQSHRPVALPLKPWAHISDHQPLAAEVQL